MKRWSVTGVSLPLDLFGSMTKTASGRAPDLAGAYSACKTRMESRSPDHPSARLRMGRGAISGILGFFYHSSTFTFTVQDLPVRTRDQQGGWVPGPRLSHQNYITEQNLDCPVSRETSSLFLSRTRMASFPYCEYHVLRLLLRYVPGGTDANFCCCCCQMSREVSRYRSRA